MFWADKIVADIEEKLADRIKTGEPLIVRDEKTISGRVHIGSMRGVSIHATVAEVLNTRGVPATFKYEINDFDVMDGLPVYLDIEQFGQFLGRPLRDVPSPDVSASNFAEYFGSEFISVIEETGFHPEIYRGSSLYLEGKMDEVIRLALDRAADVRRIYREVSGSQKPDDWYPISVVCQECGKLGTTQVYTWNGEVVSYRCTKGPGGAIGCGNEGTVSPFGGNSKLSWKVDWAAKWKVIGVDVEGGGKDHSTKGGARDVANHISREVFIHEPPYDIPHEFFLVGGAKMSSSKGSGASAREMADLLPKKILRLTLLGKQPMQAINVDPAGDTVPILYDRYDEIAQKFWDGVGDDDARLFELVHEGNPPTRHYLPRFSTVAFLAQMPHINIEEEVAGLKGEEVNDADRAELAERVEYARNWLGAYAPERYRFELQTGAIPEGARALTDAQKGALQEVVSFMEANPEASGEELHSALHDIRKTTGIEARDFFSALYQATLGKDSGPQAGWFLSVLDRDFLLSRLREVAS